MKARRPGLFSAQVNLSNQPRIALGTHELKKMKNPSGAKVSEAFLKR
jgi:hypothetical protein